MALNYLEIEKIIEELNIKDSQFQKIYPITYESFLLTFHKKGITENVLISVDHFFRIHRVETYKPEKLGKPHNLVEYIKSDLLGLFVEDILQLNNNRIIKITLKGKDKKRFLIIRLWGGYSNILITDENYKIVHLHKKSSKKNELPGELFIIPDKKESDKLYKLKKHSYTSYNLYIENYYNRQIEEQQSDKDDCLKRALLDKKRSELKSRIEKLEHKITSLRNYNKYKNYGDLIISNIHLITQGDSSVIVEDYNLGQRVNISLDPNLSPSENSSYYYSKFKKSQTTYTHSLELLENLKKELESLTIDKITTQNRTQNSTKTNKHTPGTHLNYNNWEFIVGKSAKDNEELLRRYVKGNDLWFHVRDYPGSYVFLKNKKGKTVPLEILKEAANLALYYSKGRKNGKGDVRYTNVKYLRKIKKGKPGQVIPTMDKNLYIKLDENSLKKYYTP